MKDNIIQNEITYFLDDGMLVGIDNPYCKDTCVIPDAVTSIPTGVFDYENNNEFTKIVIPDTVRKISPGAFSYNDVLVEVKLPKNSDYNRIEASTFEYCRSLTKIEVPDTITAIKKRAFAFCDLLARFDTPAFLEEIDAGAFSECKNLRSFSMPDTLTYLGRGAFIKCERLSNVKISNNAKLWCIPPNCFEHCRSLNEVFIPNNITLIDTRAFLGCKQLEMIFLPETLEKIDSAAFSDTNIERVSLPRSLRYIGQQAFYRCFNLKDVIIESINVTHLFPMSFPENEGLYIHLRTPLKIFSERGYDKYTIFDLGPRLDKTIDELLKSKKSLSEINKALIEETKIFEQEEK